jgi:hypothetical protein
MKIDRIVPYAVRKHSGIEYKKEKIAGFSSYCKDANNYLSHEIFLLTMKAYICTPC